MKDMKDYEEKAIQGLQQTEMLDTSDMDFMRNTSEHLQETWAKRQVFRTETEMVVSVLSDNKYPTPAAKYWQAVREQSVFYQETIRLGFEYRRNELKIKRIQEKLEIAEGYEKEELEIDLDEKLFGRLNMNSTAKDRVRELRAWNEIMENLDNGTFDTEDVNTHQLNSYTKRFSNQMKTITPSTPPADRMNIEGLYHTSQRVQNSGIGVADTGKVALGVKAPNQPKFVLDKKNNIKRIEGGAQ